VRGRRRRRGPRIPPRRSPILIPAGLMSRCTRAKPCVSLSDAHSEVEHFHRVRTGEARQNARLTLEAGRLFVVDCSGFGALERHFATELSVASSRTFATAAISSAALPSVVKSKRSPRAGKHATPNIHPISHAELCRVCVSCMPQGGRES